MKIKNKTELKEILYRESYDKIAIWEDGTWSEVGTSYGGEQSGDNPIGYINRAHNYDLTRKQVNELIKELEDELDREIDYLEYRKKEIEEFEYDDD